MLDQTIGLLEALPLFKGLPRRHLGYILSVAVKVYFEPGNNLIVKNYRGDTAYLILTGLAICHDFSAPPAASERIGPGCLVGEMAMLAETAHALTVQATTRIRALAFRRDAMKWVMQNDPVIATRISDNLLVRLHDFARDLRRLDNYLANIEDSAAEDYNIRALPEPPAGPHQLPPAPVRLLLQAR